MNIGLRFIAESEAHRQIRPGAPVVAGEQPCIHLAYRQAGPPSADAELGGAAAERSNLSTAVTLNRTDGNELRGTIERGRKSASEGKSPVEIGRRYVIVCLAAQAHTESQEVHFLRF